MIAKNRMLGWQLLLAVAGLSLWQYSVDSRWIDKFFFSRPSEIGARLWLMISSGSILPHLGVTLEEALLSFLIGGGLGIGGGLLLARVKWLAELLDPFIRMGNALPRVVLAPIFLLWFGLGIWSKVALGVTVVFFIVFFNTLEGVRQVEPVLISNARMLGANERQLLRHVLIPSAMAWIFSSLHISIGFAIISVVVGEYMGSSKGIGYLIAQSEGVFDTTGVFAGMAILSSVVLMIGWGVSRLERRLLRWQLKT